MILSEATFRGSFCIFVWVPREALFGDYIWEFSLRFLVVFVWHVSQNVTMRSPTSFV